MKNLIRNTLVSISLLTAAIVSAEQRVFDSGPMQATLLELYTSEGCSSCPPADQWLSQLKSSPQLWKQLVPVAFHVDYWNYLGWNDPYSKPAFSKRQRHYAENRYAKTVYTPGFFSNGREWRTWFRNRGKPDTDTNKLAGPLRATIDQQNLTATYTPAESMRARLDAPLLLNIAALGIDLATDVESGENDGKTLRHDFVVLALETLTAIPANDAFHWQHPALVKLLQKTGAKAIAFWVTRSDDPTPLQATGGWIDVQKVF